MADLAVYNRDGEQVDTVVVDEGLLGGLVRPELLKQAVVMYQANLRQGSARSRSRGMVEGSTRKIYRQKGTGNARMGTVRSPIRRGGGVAFAKRGGGFWQLMPKKMRRLARDNAILAKIESQEVKVIDSLEFDRPRTKDFVSILRNLKIEGSCMVVPAEPNEVLWKSARNIGRTDICPVGQLNAYVVLRRRTLLMTRDALEAVLRVRAGT